MAAEDPLIPNPPNCRFTRLLSSAACQWLLILLLVNSCLFHLPAIFTDTATSLHPASSAQSLTTALHQHKPGGTACWNLLCHDHRQELSCLISCIVHCKFSNIYSLCEECLSPIVSRSKLTSYRLLASKSCLDGGCSVLHSLVPIKLIWLDSPDHRTCSCCGKMLKVKSSTERLLEVNPAGLGASKANVKPPLPRTTGRSRFSWRDSLKRLRDKFTGQITAVCTASADVLSNVGYTKLKISSDSESDYLFSDDDYDCTSTSSTRAIVALDRKARLADSGEAYSMNLPCGDVSGQQGMARDFAWQEFHGKASPSPCLSPDSISLVDWPQQSDVAGGPLDPSGISLLSDIHLLCKVPSSPGAVSRKDDDAEGIDESGYIFLDKNIETDIETSFDDASQFELYNTQKNNAWAHTDKTTTTSSSSSSS